MLLGGLPLGEFVDSDAVDPCAAPERQLEKHDENVSWLIAFVAYLREHFDCRVSFKLEEGNAEKPTTGWWMQRKPPYSEDSAKASVHDADLLAYQLLKFPNMTLAPLLSYADGLSQGPVRYCVGEGHNRAAKTTSEFRTKIKVFQEKVIAKYAEKEDSIRWPSIAGFFTDAAERTGAGPARTLGDWVRTSYDPDSWFTTCEQLGD